MRNDRESVRIGLAGDVMIGRLVDKAMVKSSCRYVWGDTLPLFDAADFNLINLEAALTLSDQKVSKVFNFKARPEHVECLKLAGIDIVNLANNHVLDYSVPGLLETLKVLDHAHIKHVGAGSDWQEAISPVVQSVKGVKIGVLGCTDNESGWRAGNNVAGTFQVEIDELGAETVEREVRKLREQVDILILSVHWGPNMREEPPYHFRDFAHRMVESGVDIFHGHSAHIFQGVEIYQNSVIFYDTGDFLDDYQVDPQLRNDCSFFFYVEVADGRVSSIRLVPVLIDNFQVNVSKGLVSEETMLRMQALSSVFGTEFIQDNGSLIASVV